MGCRLVTAMRYTLVTAMRCRLVTAMRHKPCPHLRGLTNWLGRLIGFPLLCIEMGYSIFWCATLFYYFPSSMSSHKGRIERERELLVAKLLIANISNIASGMFNKYEPLEAYPSKGFR